MTSAVVVCLTASVSVRGAEKGTGRPDRSYNVTGQQLVSSCPVLALESKPILGTID